eukprot:13598302-Alexandrium_andersonii.AAC.1
MSASLVGSEMCIRDRPTVDHQNTESPSSSSFGHCSAEEARLKATNSAGTVSYTHLTLPTICSV